MDRIIEIKTQVNSVETIPTSEKVALFNELAEKWQEVLAIYSSTLNKLTGLPPTE